MTHYEVTKLFIGYLAINIRLYSIALYWVVMLHCIALALQLCCLSSASVRCLSFHINSTEHSIITQAASQWVLCFSGSLPIALIYLWLIIFFVLFSENKYDDDDDVLHSWTVLRHSSKLLRIWWMPSCLLSKRLMLPPPSTHEQAPR